MSLLDNVIKDINKKYKEDIAFKGLDRLETTKIPFSSPRLNYLLYGGIPRNRIIELIGENGSGKTTTALDLVSNAQKIFKEEGQNKKVIYIDVENTLDEMWASLLGVDVDELVVIRPQTQTAEQILDIMIDLIKTNEVGLMVLDSVATMVSQNIFDESMEKKSMAGISAPLTRFVNLAVSLLTKHQCTLIIINQVRQDVTNPYNQFVTPGGEALKHQCSVRLNFRKDGYIDEDGNDVKQSCENPAGHYVKVNVVKSKVSRNDRKIGFYTLRYRTGIDWVNDLIDCGMKFNIINQAGAWFSVFDENGELKNKEDGTPYKYQGEAKLRAAIKEDEALKEYLLKEINKNICAE